MHSSTGPGLMGHFAAPNVARLSPDCRLTPEVARAVAVGGGRSCPFRGPFVLSNARIIQSYLNAVYISRRHCAQRRELIGRIERKGNSICASGRFVRIPIAHCYEN